MKASQKIALEMSEKREKINALLGKNELSEDERTEMGTLTTRMQELELEARAAIVAEDEPVVTKTVVADGEDRELRALIDRADIGNIFESVLEHRNSDGAEAEVQAHFKVGPTAIPLPMLETRAVTPAPANVAQNQSEIIPGVFPQSCAAWFGVDLPTVPVGESVFPVLTQNATVEALAENAAGTETTGAFSAEILSPSRLQASFFYSREDKAKFGGMSESLRMNLSDALSDAMDKSVIAGTNGLLTGTNLANHNVNAVTDFAGYIENFAYGRVDGRFATMASETKSIVGSATYAHAGATYRNASVDRNALERLMEITAGVKVSDHVPPVASSKQNAVIRRGMRRDMVCAIWEDGVVLLPDEITKASTGEIVITGVMLHAVQIIRADGFYKQQTQHA